MWSYGLPNPDPNPSTNPSPLSPSTPDRPTPTATLTLTRSPLLTQVIVGSYDHSLYCLDTQSGSLLWRYETSGGIWASPAVSSDGRSAYIGSEDHSLYCTLGLKVTMSLTPTPLAAEAVRA